MALRKFLILRKLRSSCLEGRKAPIQPIADFLTRSKAGIQGPMALAVAPCSLRGASLDLRFRGGDE